AVVRGRATTMTRKRRTTPCAAGERPLRDLAPAVAPSALTSAHARACSRRRASTPTGPPAYPARRRREREGAFQPSRSALRRRVVGSRGRAPARLTHRREALEIPNAGARLVLVADTHGAPHPDSATHIATQRPWHILHAGDIGDLAVLDGLAKLAKVT